MKLVTFGRPMAPHGMGDTRLVSDEVAKRLRDQDLLSDEQPWPAAAPAAQKPARPVVKAERPQGLFDRRQAK